MGIHLFRQTYHELPDDAKLYIVFWLNYNGLRLTAGYFRNERIGICHISADIDNAFIDICLSPYTDLFTHCFLCRSLFNLYGDIQHAEIFY
jgi:hypothetical protein